jgi:(2Fe-2S) ferredoxin
MQNKNFYKHHIFFCANQKSDGSGCGTLGGEDAFNYTRNYLKEHKLWGEGQLRATLTKCLGRCEHNPVCVIYPDNIWYSYIDEEDLSCIIQQHLINGQIVKRLLIIA